MQQTNARQAIATILDADAEGHVIKIGDPSQLTLQQLPESRVPLGENLKDVPVSPPRNVADARDVVGWNVLVKEVAHRIDEDLAGRAPADRLTELFRHQPQIETVFIRGLNGLGVAVIGR